ncbi:NAD(P)H-hydrate epimerase [Solimonas aquatica]|uniref:Bifunctional NAD(P)H-hydrate repair enzyme n=1 Tax=Solimonas aquatica TaxID=489703 RepID=A0A1H9D0R7_9GAMM|nr:NAD(P)H-hydrate dehydratase [Solimonas aquatica]SEQ07055.1 NAD(P)H-hydrate epimerase [Solimonas aquatica]
MNREDRLYSAAQVRELDRLAIEGQGIAGYTLMQRAAQACWRVLRERWPQARRIAVICGRGNNGGDGYEIARLARAAGLDVKVYAVEALPTQGDGLRACQAWQAERGDIEAFSGALAPADVMVDALFGTGLARAPEGVAAQAIQAINAANAGVLAVDVPSGLDASSGRAFTPTVRAEATVSFIGNKLGLHTGDGPDYAGTRHFDDLQVPEAVYEAFAPQAQRLPQALLAQSLPRRRRGAHKGEHGHVLLIGGNLGMMGAALLAGRAALRCGAGLVSVATRTEHAALLSTAQPELMSRGVRDAIELRPLLARADVVAIGPGLGQDAWARGLWSATLESGKPLIVDADALNLLAAEPVALPDAVLTPHPGEAGRLLGLGNAQVQADRLGALRALEARYGATVLLKGAGTLISGRPPAVCTFGNPGMAVGGMGDVLSGVIAALRAQGLSAEAAAQNGAVLHALAGDRVAAGGERGLLPSDLLVVLRSLANPL